MTDPNTHTGSTSPQPRDWHPSYDDVRNTAAALVHHTGGYVEIPLVFVDAQLHYHWVENTSPAVGPWFPVRWVAVAKIFRPGTKPELVMLAPLETPDEIRGLKRVAVQLGNFAALVHHTNRVVFLLTAEHVEKHLPPVLDSSGTLDV